MHWKGEIITPIMTRNSRVLCLRHLYRVELKSAWKNANNLISLPLTRGREYSTGYCRVGYCGTWLVRWSDDKRKFTLDFCKMKCRKEQHLFLRMERDVFLRKEKISCKLSAFFPWLSSKIYFLCVEQNILLNIKEILLNLWWKRILFSVHAP